MIREGHDPKAAFSAGLRIRSFPQEYPFRMLGLRAQHPGKAAQST
jgi:hypothetical protein